jgi:hypothetical protein
MVIVCAAFIVRAALLTGVREKAGKASATMSGLMANVFLGNPKCKFRKRNFISIVFQVVVLRHSWPFKLVVETAYFKSVKKCSVKFSSYLLMLFVIGL